MNWMVAGLLASGRTRAEIIISFCSREREWVLVGVMLDEIFAMSLPYLSRKMTEVRRGYSPGIETPKSILPSV
jgi:hypothetical protein